MAGGVEGWARQPEVRGCIPRGSGCWSTLSHPRIGRGGGSRFLEQAEDLAAGLVHCRRIAGLAPLDDAKGITGALVGYLNITGLGHAESDPYLQPRNGIRLLRGRRRVLDASRPIIGYQAAARRRRGRNQR